MESGILGPEKLVPERYVVTPLYSHLRLAERFGWGVIRALRRMDVVGVRQLVEFDGLRQVEEVREGLSRVG